MYDIGIQFNYEDFTVIYYIKIILGCIPVKFLTLYRKKMRGNRKTLVHF
jgi:hypothetical protein